MRTKCTRSVILTGFAMVLTMVILTLYNRAPVYFRPTDMTVKSTTKVPSTLVAGLTANTVKTACLKITEAELNNVKTTKHAIPYIIHQIYKNYDVPKQYIKLIESCRRVNPQFKHLVWTDEKASEFINKVYPYLSDLYAKYKEGAQKADFLRVLVLFHFGGVYMDMDVECRKPLATALDENFDASAIMDHERRLQTRLRWNRNYSVMNSVMIARKHHPYMKYLLDKFPESLKHGNVMWRTGPFYVHDRMLEYQRVKRSKEDQVLLAPPSAFSPVLDPSLFGRYNGICKGDYKKLSEPYRLGCVEWDSLHRKQENFSVVTKDSLLIHWFLHLAYGFMSHAIKGRDNFCRYVDGLYEYVP